MKKKCAKDECDGLLLILVEQDFKNYPSSLASMCPKSRCTMSLSIFFRKPASCARLAAGTFIEVSSRNISWRAVSQCSQWKLDGARNWRECFETKPAEKSVRQLVAKSTGQMELESSEESHQTARQIPGSHFDSGLSLGRCRRPD